MDANDSPFSSSSDLNSEYRILLDSISHPDIGSTPEFRVCYTKGSGKSEINSSFTRRVMDANGNMQTVHNICYAPNPDYKAPEPYNVYFTLEQREQMARIPLFQKAFSLLQSGADFHARNAQQKSFIGLFMEYWPVSEANVWRDNPINYPTCLDHKELSSYMAGYKNVPDVPQFLKKYSHRRKMALLGDTGRFGLLILGSSVIWLPLSLLFGDPIYHVFAKPIINFLANAPFSIPWVGALVGAFLAYGGIMTLRGGKKNDGTPIKPFVKAAKTLLAAICIAYTALCLASGIKSCGTNGRPIEKSHFKISECKTDRKAKEKPTFALRACPPAAASVEKKAFSCSKELYMHASRMTSLRISRASQIGSRNQAGTIQLKLPARG